ncbi:DUF742 domain-containing protein [Pseudonocardia bannensis]|uniref:DUF742 domain-containing protein n=1 Tax=Pseudonocardia bannensis TaxID=630973 RepID=A0A848DSS4_9PSEU|nr:DUF742 domain-containing protein [Pseudonocardia bannensis]NMH95563.1 DUF742 domain-containing protein [Pseudonocardia bannensis]
MSDHLADAGRVVPVYAVTGGRTRSTGRELPIEAMVSTTGRADWATDLQMEYRMILELAERPVCLVEIGAVLEVPVGVARVLVSDLADAGCLTVHTAPPTDDGRPGADVLEQLLAGLRAR